MNRSGLFFTVLMIICLTGCNSGKQITKMSPDIYNHWMHSHEEHVGDVEYFRPSTYQFPPSRGRLGFEIKKEGQFTLYTIAPADGRDQIDGEWIFVPPDTIIAEFPGIGNRDFQFKIVSCNKELLIIKR